MLRIGLSVMSGLYSDKSNNNTISYNVPKEEGNNHFMVMNQTNTEEVTTAITTTTT